MSNQDSVVIAPQSVRLFHQSLFKTLVYFFFLILVLAGAFKAFPLVVDALFLIVIAAILTTVFNPLVDRLESSGLRRIYGTLLMFGGIIGMVALGVIKGIPTLLSEISRIKHVIQQNAATDSLDSIMADINSRIAEYIPGFQLDLDLISSLSSQFFSQLGSVLAGALDTLATVIFILIITMFFLVDGKRMTKQLIGMVPNRYFEMSLNITYKTKQQLTNFLRGQLLAALGVAIQSFIGLTLLNWLFDTNISGVLLISSIAGMANMIPFVGPFMGMVPAIIVSLFNNLGDPVAVSNFYYILHIIGMFLIVQMIDNNIISPIVVSGSMEMHPLTVILLILVGSQLGVLGMFLAVPAWGISKVVIQEVYQGLKGHHLI
ncbi:MAG: AI-2E family transporter [Candidatus Marinimicrobia bacterium]|jgi:predicted PurR-regulated permease PerM|nr:AI-2E family transporter [Candidatus Neomarinimicrobiota bacterium]MBT3631655.1 AI-2E family transporter [Candidatus Neomarinimicrobiota bacterium]MBT3825856.1 AI-2E family transporter [Candidatus Neomarinimicrobiota bacterium]MBT4129953.1 AI-2E family transporter [Candidatus Neomarinimicrobiota bacterium]MBT4296061.1 AI-2E family transporter [Candidatus Neomarinimicrobiota bacterium]